MRVLYVLMMGLLMCSFWAAFVKLRARETELTPILGWIMGLAFFIVGPLTVIAIRGGYEVPSFYEANASYARVDLTAGEFRLAVAAVWAALLFSFLMVAVFAPDRQMDRQIIYARINEAKLKRVLLITSGLAIFTYLAMIQMVGGLEVFLVSHWFKRQEDLVSRLGDWYVLFSRIAIADQILFTAAAALFMNEQVKRRKVNWRFSILIFLLFLLQIAMTGNRIFFGLYLMSFGASCWLYRRKRPMVVFLTVAPLLIFIFSAWNYFRHNLSTIDADIPTYMQGDLGNRSITSLMDAFEGNDTLVLLHIINDFGSKRSYLYGESYARVLYFLVPRSIYPEKPAGFSLQMGALYEPGSDTSLAVTQLGECWANFGPLSLLLFPLMTAVIMKLSRSPWVNPQRHALLSTTVFVLFIWIARASFEDNFITFMLAIALSVILGLEKGLCDESLTVREGLHGRTA